MKYEETFRETGRSFFECAWRRKGGDSFLEEKKGLTKPEGMNKLITERKRQRTERVGKKISQQRETVAG